jgi:Uma2 family endonuclease
MSAALQKPWTIERFFAWAESRDGRYEFDGTRPVAMNGGSIRHGIITGNIRSALTARLRGSPCSFHGPDVAIQTNGNSIRYPDALVTCAKLSQSARIVPDPVIVFEVLSPDSGGRDRIEKLREYAAVPSIRRYVIVESAGIGLTVMHRPEGGDAFTALPLSAGETLHLPEIGIEVPVGEFYLDVEFDDEAPAE